MKTIFMQGITDVWAELDGKGGIIISAFIEGAECIVKSQMDEDEIIDQVPDTFKYGVDYRQVDYDSPPEPTYFEKMPIEQWYREYGSESAMLKSLLYSRKMWQLEISTP